MFYNISKISKAITALLALSVLFTWVGCGSGNDNEAAINEASSANIIAIITANQAVAAAIQTDSAQNVDCESSGVANVTGNIVSGQPDTSFNLTIDFVDCTGLNGDLNVSGSGNTDGQNFTFNYNINGEAGSESCDLTYDGLNIIFENGTARLDGLLSAECDSGDVICNYDNVVITDQQALEDACS